MLTIKYVVVKTLTEKNSPLPKPEGPITQFGQLTPRLGTNAIDARAIARFHYSVHERRSADTVKLEK